MTQTQREQELARTHRQIITSITAIEELLIYLRAKLATLDCPVDTGKVQSRVQQLLSKGE